MSSASVTRLVDECFGLKECIKDVYSANPKEAVAVDLEGVDLGRQGRVAIMQLHAKGSCTVWLIDVTVLGSSAFDTTDDKGKSLRGLLEDSAIKKVSGFS